MKRSEHLEALDRLQRLESAPIPTDRLDAMRTALDLLTADHAAFTHQIDTLIDDVQDLETQGKEFVLALAEGIERRERADRRIKATVARARQELRDGGVVDEGVEAEASQLREFDGKRGEEIELQPMPAAVDGNREELSSIPGVSLRDLQRVRGIG